MPSTTDYRNRKNECTRRATLKVFSLTNSNLLRIKFPVRSASASVLSKKNEYYVEDNLKILLILGKDSASNMSCVSL